MFALLSDPHVERQEEAFAGARPDGFVARC